MELYDTNRFGSALMRNKNIIKFYSKEMNFVWLFFFKVLRNWRAYNSRKLYYGNQQKVLKFKKTSPFSQNLFIESRFLIGSTAPWPLFQFQKDFTVKGYKNYWYYTFQILIKMKNFKNVRWKKSSLSVNCYSVGNKTKA